MTNKNVNKCVDCARFIKGKCPAMYSGSAGFKCVYFKELNKKQNGIID